MGFQTMDSFKALRDFWRSPCGTDAGRKCVEDSTPRWELQESLMDPCLRFGSAPRHCAERIIACKKSWPNCMRSKKANCIEAVLGHEGAWSTSKEATEGQE